MSDSFLLNDLVKRALAEDLGYGDRTTEALFPSPLAATGFIVAKEDLVLAGLDLVRVVFQTLDPSVIFEEKYASGEKVEKGAQIAQVSGDARILLKGERTALNFLQRLSGIATLTCRFVDRTQGTSARIVDTRKTTPGLRACEKEAVRYGGGRNHRFHLGDLILIKDNHILLGGGVAQAIRAVRAAKPHSLKVEVEVSTFSELEEALQVGVEIIMLDNMPLREIKKAVGLIKAKAPETLVEVSGGVNLEHVSKIAACGVDLISVGALTHSAPAVDISFDITPASRPSGRRSPVGA
ncbi:MAG: carboxylating nicotinate-nucleotide diphosphorylase [Nitrospira sp.]|nr:carboxylating nicotinate-nucleotide diphosphorylase [Candidatus Manganitrophaceae bacterium]HIL35030.1 carboxylating nicotinate-nucleotide diphosphorylase [Candidatus Manganitrophaceae bacterium]